MSWEDEYKARIRKFIAEQGSPVRLDRADSPEELIFGTTPAWRDSHAASTYGWTDYDAVQHVHPYDKKKKPCEWIIPDGAEVCEVSYSEFQGTFTSNIDKVGVNIYPVRCACGKYDKVVLRWDGSLTKILHSLLGIDGSPITL